MAHVLIVDDDALVRELYSLWLQERGHTTWQADSVAAAQAILNRQPCDVVISDIRMTHANGIDLLAWIGQQEEHLPVILITGAPAVDTAVSALRLNAYDYLLKPIEEAQLAQSVERADQYHRLLHEKERLQRENMRYQQELEARVAAQTAALHRLNQRLLTLHQLVQSMNTLNEDAHLHAAALAEARSAFRFDLLALLTIHWDEAYFETLSLHTAAEIKRGEVFLDLAQPELRAAIAQDRPLLINHITPERAWLRLPELPLRSLGIFPALNEWPIRTTLLAVGHTTEDAFDGSAELVLKTLAGHLRAVLINTRLYTQVRQALRVREEVLQNVSHELRTPLAIIQGYAEVLRAQDAAADSLIDAGLAAILEQSQHLHHLVDQLIAFHEIASTPLQRTRVHVGLWVQTVAGGWRRVLATRGQTLELHLAANVGDVSANADYLQQVLNNIISNAHKFSPDGSVIVARAWRQQAEVYIAITDQGIGLAAEQLPLIFERFYQADSGANRQFAGMGLGLSLAQQIIERHGGRIWAESAGLGQGVTITFTLPAIGG